LPKAAHAREWRCARVHRDVYSVGGVMTVARRIVRMWQWAWLGLVVMATGGCVQTSRIDEGVTIDKLAAAQRAVAVMRIGAASPTCINVQVLLGRREGEGYRRGKIVTVALVRSLGASQVAEIELEPGEHHVIGYKCIADGKATAVAEMVPGGLFKTSYARFTLNAGEIVNVGYFHFGASHEGRSLFGRPVRTDVEITEWPLAEIERFKQARPTVYAQMITRLMMPDAAPPSTEQMAQTCATWAKLKADKKAQDVPPECGGAATQKKRMNNGT